jgi:hypothetical protein
MKIVIIPIGTCGNVQPFVALGVRLKQVRHQVTPSPAQLGLRLLRRLPKILTQHFEVLVLTDTAFGSNEFVTRVRQLKHHALVGVRCNRKLEDGRGLTQLHKRGQQVRLSGLKFPVPL